MSDERLTQPIQADLLLQVYAKVEVLISETRAQNEHIMALSAHVKTQNGRISVVERYQWLSIGGMAVLMFLIVAGIGIAGLVLANVT